MWNAAKRAVSIALMALALAVPAISQTGMPAQFFGLHTVFRLVASGTVVGTMTATNNPTSWSITNFSPSGVNGYFAINNSGTITVTSTGSTNLSGQTGTAVLTVQATNAFGSGTGTATINYSPAQFQFNSSASGGSGQFSHVGTQVPDMYYGNNGAVFSDIILQSSGNNGPWDCGSGFGSNCALDSTGAPTTAPAQTVWTTDYPSGVYTLSYTGASGAVTISNCSASLGSPTVNGTSVSYPLTITRNATTTPGGTGFCIMQTSSVISNVHIKAPAADTSGDYLTSYLQKMAPFNPLRHMDALMTNGTQTPLNNPCGYNCTHTWSQRTLPGQASGLSMQGIAYDYIIEYANITGKDVWINIPPYATDDYVCRLGRLFFYGETGSADNGSNCSTTAAATGPFSTIVPTGINTTSHIYVEWANEPWNAVFPQWDLAYCIGNLGPASGHTCQPLNLTSASTISTIVTNDINNTGLPWDTTASNPFARQLDVAADFARRDGVILKQVFGPRSSQILNTVNVQAAAVGGGGASGMTFVANAFGGGNPVTGGIDVMATAPYVSASNESGNCDGGTTTTACTNDLLAVLSPGGVSYGYVTSNLAFINSFAAPRMAYANYEGGPNFNSTASSVYNNNVATTMYNVTQENYTVMLGPQSGKTAAYVFFTSSLPVTWQYILNIHDSGQQKWDGALSAILQPGDVNGDGLVNATDCAIIDANKGKTGAFRADGDLNHDGSVGADDAAIVNAAGVPCT